jgi:hypothetical protein
MDWQPGLDTPGRRLDRQPLPSYPREAYVAVKKVWLGISMSSRSVVQAGEMFIGDRRQGGVGKTAYECLAEGGAGDGEDDEMQSKTRESDEERRDFSYSGCAGTLGSARVWLVLLLPRLRHVSGMLAAR